MKKITIALGLFLFSLGTQAALVATTRIVGVVKEFNEEKVKLCTAESENKNCFFVPRQSIDAKEYRLQTGKTVVAFVDTKDFLIEAIGIGKKSPASAKVKKVK